MTLEELYTELNKMYPTTYSHFNKPMKPPFICYYEDESNNFYADNMIYGTKKTVIIELYTSKKDLNVERRLEKILKENKILWYSTSQYIKEENIFVKAYYIEIMEGKTHE